MGMNSLGLGFVFEAKDLATGVMDKVGAKFLDVEGRTSAAGKAMQTSMKQFGTGMAVFGAGALGLAALGPATQLAQDFAFEIAKLRTVVDEASFSTEALRGNTMGLATSYGIDALKQADALYDVLGAGISDATKAIDMMEVANEFAIGGTTELKGAVDVLTSAVNTYADTGLNAKKAADLMFTAIAAGKTTAKELSQSLGEVAPTAHAAGVSFAELQASIAALTVQGIKTPQAITGLNAVMSNIMKPTSEAEKEAKRLGIAFDATALKTKGLAGVLAQLEGNTKVNDKTMTQLFGSIDGAKAAFVLTSNGGAKFKEVLGQMDKELQNVDESARATKKAFEIMAATGKFQAQRFEALTKNAQILVGEGLEPLQAGGLKLANNLLEAFARIPKPIRDVAVRAFALAAVFLTVVGGALALKAGLGLVAAGLAAAGVTVSGFLLTMAPVLLIFGAVTLAVLAFREALRTNLGGMGGFFAESFGKAKLAVQALGELFSTGGFSGDLLAELDRAENQGVQNFAINVFVWFKRIEGYVKGMVEGFQEGVQAAKPVFQEFTTAIERLGAAFGFVSAEVDPISNGQKLDAAGDSGKRMGLRLAEAASKIVRGITMAVDALERFVNFMKPVVSGIGNFVDAIGGAQTVVTALEIALVFMAAKGLAGAVVGLVGVATSAFTAAGGMGSLTAALGAMRAMNVASSLAAAGAGIKALVASSAVALGPIGALAAAITALYLAFDQLSKLKKEMGEHGASDMWKKFKNDVGITSDEEYQHELGIRTGERDMYGMLHDLPATPTRRDRFGNFAPDPVSFYRGDSSTAAAAGGNAQDGAALASLPDQVGRAVEAGASRSKTMVSGDVYLGTEKVGEIMASYEASQGNRSSVPGAIGD